MKYILSNMIVSDKLNEVILNELYSKSEIVGVEGSVPFFIYNGNYNNIDSSEIFLYPDFKEIEQFYKPYVDMFIFDCGNVLLEPKDKNNCLGNVIFTEYANNKHYYFTISNLDIAQYLIEQYPNIQLILHQNFTMFHDDKEILEAIKMLGKNLSYIIITNKNKCDTINFPKIYLLKYFNTCEKCSRYKYCIEQECLSALNYSSYSIFKDCKKKMLRSDTEMYEEIQKIKEIKDIEYIMFDTVLLDMANQDNGITLYGLYDSLLKMEEEN